MTAAINPTSHKLTTPYLTNDEFLYAPTSLDIDNLVFNSSDPDVQASELTNVIQRASSWADTFCLQTLGATSETETLRSRVTPDGMIKFHLRYSPMIALTDLWFGGTPLNMYQAQNVQTAWLEDQQVIYPYSQVGSLMTSQGPIQFGFPATAGNQVYLKATYIAGYVNTTIDEAIQGESELTVKSGFGIIAGTELKIYDGQYTENVTVADTYEFGSKTVPLTEPLLYSHNTGISISALPPAVKQAVILVTSAYIKVRGDSSMTMSIGSTPSSYSTSNIPADIAGDLNMAMNLLKPFRRIR